MAAKSAMKNPVISIVIPTYNRANLLSQAIESVLAQTFTSYELIIVDDGSTDDTVKLISKYQKNNPRIQYIYQENVGGAAARNAGWRKASAKYLFFLDSDDLLLPTALELLISRAQNNPTLGVIGGGYQYIDLRGVVIGERKAWTNNSLTVERWLKDCPFIIGATLAKKKWLEQVDGFDPVQEAAQDWDLWLRLASAGCQMGWVEQIVCQYRKHEQELTSNPQRQKRGVIRMFDKFFAQPDLPAHIQKQKNEIYANIYITAAAREYAAGNITIGKKELQQAYQIMPKWGRSGILLENMLRRGQSPGITRDSLIYEKQLLNNLPSELNCGTILKRTTARLAAAELFASRKKNEWSKIGSLWWAVAQNDPGWLTNVGFWSIGLRCLQKHLKSKF